MLHHDLTVAFRSVAKRPLRSALRVTVLAFGLFCFIAAYLCTSYFRSYDTQWAKADRTYAIFEALDWPQGGLHVPSAPRSTPSLAEQLPLDMPQIEAVARYRRFNSAFVRTQGGEAYRRIGAADPELLDVFDFDLVAGDLHGALSTPQSAIITESAATRIFGTRGATAQELIGETLTLTASGTADIAIAAVIRDPPIASHLGGGVYGFYAESIGLLVSWDLWDVIAPPQVRTPNWYALTAFTYVVLPADDSLTVGELNRRLPDILARHAQPPVPGLALSIEARPVSAIATNLLQDSLQFSRGRTWALDILELLSIFAAVVLAVACLNFVNLQTVSAAGRAREIGIRKTVGARARQVVVQDLVRTGTLVLAATVLALGAFSLLHGLVPTQWQSTFALTWNEPRFWGFLAVLVPGITLLAGLYPALVLARVPPLDALRIGALRAGPKLLRGMLVGSQFAVATFLIAAVVVLYMERDAAREAALGRFDDQYVLLPRAPNASSPPEVLANELLEEPGIRGVTATMQYPWAYTGPKLAASRGVDATLPTVLLDTPTVGYDYFAVMDIPVLAGRAFGRSRDDVASRDTSSAPDVQRSVPIKVILDRRAVRALGWMNPADAIGERIYSPGAAQAWEVIGVVEDAPISILGTGGEGVLYYLNPAQTQFTIVRIAKDDVAASLAAIDDVLTRLAAEGTAIRRGPFLDQAFDALYRQYAVIDTVIAWIGALAIAIAGIGLVGLASDVTVRRTREIAVRKTQGASSARILQLLLLDFLKPVLIANLAASPFIFFAAERYIRAFAVSVGVTPLPFLIALAATLAVSVAAVGSRVLHAASLKPADALRHE